MKDEGALELVRELKRLYRERVEIRAATNRAGRVESNLVAAVESIVDENASLHRRLRELSEQITHQMLSRDNKAKDAQPPTAKAH